VNRTSAKLSGKEKKQWWYLEVLATVTEHPQSPQTLLAEYTH